TTTSTLVYSTEEATLCTDCASGSCKRTIPHLRRITYMMLTFCVFPLHYDRRIDTCHDSARRPGHVHLEKYSMGRMIPRHQFGTDYSAADLETQPMRRIVTAASKVPEVTIFFWIIKVLSTGMGETTSDFLVHTIDPVIAVAIAGACFFAALILQLLARRYVPWIYWLTVVMVAIFGTMVADAVHIVLHVEYLVSVIFFSFALLAVFVAWYASERTLSIHSIYTLRRELFYWTTIVTTFALGTALGDLTATTLPSVGGIATTTSHLGYFMSGVLFAILFFLP